VLGTAKLDVVSGPSTGWLPSNKPSDISSLAMPFFGDCFPADIPLRPMVCPAQQQVCPAQQLCSTSTRLTAVVAPHYPLKNAKMIPPGDPAPPGVELLFLVVERRIMVGGSLVYL